MTHYTSVLGHEITHVLKRHTYLANRNARKKMVAINVLSTVANVSGQMSGGSNMTGLVAALIGATATSAEAVLQATIFGYSRELEREADWNGQRLMARAGYDPRAMARTFDLLGEQLEFEPVEGIYRSHPKLQERRQVAREMTPALSTRPQELAPVDQYLTAAAPAICYNIHADIESRRARTALQRAKKLEGWKPEEPTHQLLLADSYRALGAKTEQPSQEEVTKHGQVEDRKNYFLLTDKQEQQKLLSQVGGPERKRANEERAEKIYLETIGCKPEFADAYRGLGFLYEQESRGADAVEQYRRYLELAPPDAMDRLRIQHRIDLIEKPPSVAAAQ